MAITTNAQVFSVVNLLFHAHFLDASRCSFACLFFSNGNSFDRMNIEIRLYIQKPQNDQMIRTITRTHEHGYWHAQKPHSLFLFLKYKNAKNSNAHKHTHTCAHTDSEIVTRISSNSLLIISKSLYKLYKNLSCWAREAFKFRGIQANAKAHWQNWNVYVCVLARVLHLGHGYCAFFPSLANRLLPLYSARATSKVQGTIEARTYLITLLQ